MLVDEVSGAISHQPSVTLLDANVKRINRKDRRVPSPLAGPQSGTVRCCAAQGRSIDVQRGSSVEDK
jgi:hypothetical protein